MHYRHLFGPVMSRRLGRSLGIDLTPAKWCPFDCVYCEAGPTTKRTVRRDEFFPAAGVIRELKDFLSGRPELDYITFSGSGEPTLSSSVGEIVRFLKSSYPEYRVALLTNGVLLGDEQVQEEILPIDVVIPTLSSADERIFRKIHRPCRGITAAGLISALIDFRNKYAHELWLEVFVVPGMNDSDEEIRLLAEAVRKIRPDKVQLNTLDRPGAVDWIRPAGPEELARFRQKLGYPVTETVGLPDLSAPSSGIPEEPLEMISAILKRRPSTAEEIAAETGLRPAEVSKYLRTLMMDHHVTAARQPRGVFYSWTGA